jgi:glycosyltransferase involved in cell wall biosynthesis
VTGAVGPPPVGVIVTGTDPRDPRGGIAVAMAGYLAALDRAGLLAGVVPTYRRPRWRDKWLPALRALRTVPQAVRRLRSQGRTPIVYAHAGAGVSLAREGLVLLGARLAGAVTVLQLHANAVDRYLEHPARRRLMALAVAPAHVLSVLTPYWRARLASRGFRQPMIVVPDPLPPDFEAVARAGGPSGRGPDGVVTVVTLTRLEHGKGVDLLIRAAALLPPRAFRVVVAGDGPERRRYEALTRALGVDDVTFLGWVSGEEKHRALRSADVFCLPTQNDSFGMGFLEAMCYGLPVVALRWGNVPAVVEDGRTAILVDAPLPESLARALAALHDPARRASLGAAGRRLALERYGLDATAERLAGEFRRIAAATRRRP